MFLTWVDFAVGSFEVFFPRGSQFSSLNKNQQFQFNLDEGHRFVNIMHPAVYYFISCCY